MSRVLLAIGDPNGVGPELAAKSVAALGAAAPVVVGDRCAIEPYAAASGLRVRPARLGAPAEAGLCDVVDTGILSADQLHTGEVRSEAGAATLEYVKAAVQLSTQGYAGIVAGPHSETAVSEAGISFAGYPRFIAELTGVEPDHAFLMLIGGGLRLVHATLHMSMLEALRRLDVNLVVEAGVALHRSLQSMGITAPRLGMFGINCHASEGGLFGDEDLRITAPAADQLRALGVNITDPLGADVLLGARDRDGYLAMYHDQGHIPVKLLAGRGAAALTVGAGVPFASVGHGPAFNIAGQGSGDPTAMLAALNLFASSAEGVVAV